MAGLKSKHTIIIILIAVIAIFLLSNFTKKTSSTGMTMVRGNVYLNSVLTPNIWVTVQCKNNIVVVQSSSSGSYSTLFTELECPPGTTVKISAQAVTTTAAVPSSSSFYNIVQQNIFVTSSLCGNSALNSPEQCDDGNQNFYDGCTPACYREFCGDGIYQSMMEQCDDGNAVNGDGCTASCIIEAPAVTSTCVQESANVATSCGGLATGKYNVKTGSPVTNPANMYDGNWNTYATFGVGQLRYFFNYTVPTNIRMANFSVKYSGSGSDAIYILEKTMPIPPECFDMYSNTKIAFQGVFETSDYTQGVIFCLAADGGTGTWTTLNYEDLHNGLFASSLITNTAMRYYEDKVMWMWVACGDRRLGGTEKCDDGNLISGDGCSSTCTLEPKPYTYMQSSKKIFLSSYSTLQGFIDNAKLWVSA